MVGDDPDRGIAKAAEGFGEGRIRGVKAAEALGIELVGPSAGEERGVRGKRPGRTGMGGVETNAASREPRQKRGRVALVAVETETIGANGIHDNQEDVRRISRRRGAACKSPSQRERFPAECPARQQHDHARHYRNRQSHRPEEPRPVRQHPRRDLNRAARRENHAGIRIQPADQQELTQTCKKHEHADDHLGRFSTRPEPGHDCERETANREQDQVGGRHHPEEMRAPEIDAVAETIDPQDQERQLDQSRRQPERDRQPEHGERAAPPANDRRFRLRLTLFELGAGILCGRHRTDIPR